jgi:MoaA/NifB/PqqE/SkfB family radical SAM enzyme
VRVDAAADLPLPLLGRVRAAVRAAKPDAVVFGEVVPACIDRFAPHVLDAASDFAYREVLVGWLAGESAARWADVAAARRWRGAASELALGFTGTHDQPRIATVTQDAALARLALVVVALGARVPLFYYGDEVGLAAPAEDRDRAFEDSWPDRQPMPWQEAAWDRATFEAVKDALALRREHALLRRGDEELRALGDDVVLVRRHLLGEAIDIVVYRGACVRTLELPGGGGARLLFALGEIGLIGTTLRLGPRSLAVIDRREPFSIELATHNAAIAAEAFAGGRTECPAYPARLYLTVTEACNLRCAHCITDAPARTRSGRARTVQRWLLAALDDAFAHADYVAFTHGGEPLAAPVFPEVLRRIARATRPGRADVHLATNGMLLDEERTGALIDLGVTSVMVSLDGATGPTNDRIRVLGRYERVVANIAAAIALRQRRNADLRIGISTIVGASNVRELPALARLCRELGVDWLKIEETYPATPFARHDLYALGDAELADAVAAVREVLADGSVVLVDHLAPPTECTCSADPAALAFRVVDDYANRATFSPCRAAWEQAAIDPDGTVHSSTTRAPRSARCSTRRCSRYGMRRARSPFAGAHMLAPRPHAAVAASTRGVPQEHDATRPSRTCAVVSFGVRSQQPRRARRERPCAGTDRRVGGGRCTQRRGAGLPGSPRPANSSEVDCVDLRACWFLRRRPAFSCLFLRLTRVAAVLEAMADPL